MTEQTQSALPGAESPADGQTVPGQGKDSGESQKGSESPKGNREARYRVERNEAREALAAAQARIEAIQTREVERLAGKHLAQPADLFALSGKTLADLLDDNGDVDAERVAEVAAAVLAARPGLRPNARLVDLTQGLGGNPPKTKPSFDDLFKR
ncbi:hypothetical protein LAUMK191_04099 [Mycobacterium attenuatum]|uniref:hypothetical protein n=1 Tax=Mycobacterium attenuatum TaxID=2341086 RepID=UPI000F03BB77|nr:hypothetical protein [Mycobacterium attenuatum]VBA57608.1 hypothetical protein LAUMK191_04099 [Mycobacterium attenuatum]